ncbi:MAG: hypothetical protein M3O35_18195 [Acidobacteriota bacterium]|nr:hypothetical protein [Acidobacteriota bacterium]
MKLRALAVLLAGVCAVAQDGRPQLTWQGSVDGVTILYLRGNRIRVENKRGEPVQSQKVKFYNPLPDTRQSVRVSLLEGRGAVRVIDQPRLENDYTAAVQIEDLQSGRSFYSLAFYWDAGFATSRHGKSGKLSWSGRVDDEVTVTCRADQCVSEVVRGAAVMRERAKFSQPLPRAEVRVSLENIQGRGEIRLKEQPRRDNNYAARVQIRDLEPGIGDYAFVLTWTPEPRGDKEPVAAQRGLLWSARVDGRVRVTVQGGSAYSEAVPGGSVTAEHADWLRPLPATDGLNPALKKLAGRGTAEIVEMPSSGNHYRLVFELGHAGGGPDNYEIEVDW